VYILILKLLNNIESIHCKFILEGRATITLKDPNFILVLQKVVDKQLVQHFFFVLIFFKS
jgi:hypothetical protein